MQIKSGGSQKNTTRVDPHGFSVWITARCGMSPSIRGVFIISEPVNRTVCPLPFVDVDGKYCFAVTMKKQNADDSANLCQQLGGSLATLDTAEKSASFTQYLEGMFNF